MDESRFDPSGFFEFDLALGAVRTRGGSRVVVLSDAVISPLVGLAVRQGDLTPLRKLGNQLGAEAAESLPSPVTQASPEMVATRVGAVLALFGWGRMRMERWGDAMVAMLESAPSLDADRLGVAALLGGIFSTLVGREVACVPVGPDQRYILVDPRIAEEVWSWSKESIDVAGVAQRLSAEVS